MGMCSATVLMLIWDEILPVTVRLLLSLLSVALFIEKALLNKNMEKASIKRCFILITNCSSILLRVCVEGVHSMCVHTSFSSLTKLVKSGCTYFMVCFSIVIHSF